MRKFVTVIVSGYLSDDVEPATSDGTCAYVGAPEEVIAATRNGVPVKVESMYPEISMGDVWITQPEVKLYVTDIEN